MRIAGRLVALRPHGKTTFAHLEDATGRIQLYFRRDELGDAAYAVLWYGPIFSAWRTDRFTGYRTQPQPKGDPLESWGGPSAVWWTLKPVGTGGPGGGGGTVEPRGTPAAAWIGIAAGVVIIIAAIVLGRRRRGEEEEA